MNWNLILRPILYIFSIFARIALNLFWKKVEPPPEVDKAVLLAAPHTSGMDAFWAIVYSVAFVNYRRKILFAVKKEENKFPQGLIYKLFGGGLFIDREDKSSTIMNKFILEMNKNKKIFIGIFAEGTRLPVKKFNPGFYYIAYRSNAPIVGVNFDYGKSEIRSSELFYPTGSYKNDIHFWEKFFKGTKGRNPENYKVFSEPMA